MWKYQCKKQLLVLAVMFIIGAVLFGMFDYQKEFIMSMLMEITDDKAILNDPYLYYIIGGAMLAGIANGLLILIYAMQRFQAPYLYLILLFALGIVRIAIMIGMLLLIPCVIVCLYGWLTIPNRGKQKELEKNKLTTIDEIERVYRLHHQFDDQYDDVAKKTARFIWLTNLVFALGLASLFLVFLYVDNFVVVLLCVFLYMYLFFEITRRRNAAMQPFVSLLYEQCNPQACASAIFTLSKRLHKKKSFALPQHMAQCMIYLDDPHLAVDVLVTCDQSKGSMVYAYHSLMAYAYYLLGDRSMVQHAYDDCEKYGAKTSKGPMLMLRQQALEGIENRLDLMDKNFNRARDYFKNGLKNVPYEFQRVDYHYYSGLISYVEQDMSEAKTHFEYVAEHGNTCSVAQKAKNFLKSIEQTEY